MGSLRRLPGSASSLLRIRSATSGRRGSGCGRRTDRIRRPERRAGERSAARGRAARATSDGRRPGDLESHRGADRTSPAPTPRTWSSAPAPSAELSPASARRVRRASPRSPHGDTTSAAADSSMNSVSFVIMPSSWTAGGSTAANASATTRARRDSGSHRSRPPQTNPRRSIPHSAASHPSAPAPRPCATRTAAIR